MYNQVHMYLEIVFGVFHKKIIRQINLEYEHEYEQILSVSRCFLTNVRVDLLECCLTNDGGLQSRGVNTRTRAPSVRINYWTLAAQPPSSFQHTLSTLGKNSNIYCNFCWTHFFQEQWRKWSNGRSWSACSRTVSTVLSNSKRIHLHSYHNHDQSSSPNFIINWNQLLIPQSNSGDHNGLFI